MIKKATSRKPIPKTQNAELAAIWTATGHVAHQSKRELLTPAARAGLSPFMTAAVDLALATVCNTEEDTTAILEKVRAGLEEARRVLPSIQNHLDKPLSAEAAELWKRRLVRHSVTTVRDFSIGTDRPPPSPVRDVEYEPYTTTPAAHLEEPDPSRLWLIEHLWQRSGTGIVGGGAKGAKTWLCLDLALSVVSGTRALDRFAVHRPGGVLFVSAEGGQAYLRQRLTAMCAHRGLKLDSLPHPLNIIPNAIRIDTPDGLGRLKATIKASRPVLLVLDPLVRMHRIDENSASCVSALLSNLTEIQQAYDLAVLVAHHSTKHGSRKGAMSGQAFRGSSDLYAWGDSNIFLGKSDKKFVLAAEHRAAPATEQWTMMATADEHPRLCIVENDSEESSELTQQAEDERLQGEILNALKAGPRSTTEIRKAVTGSNARISAAINALEAARKIARVGRLWALTNGHGTRPHAISA